MALASNVTIALTFVFANLLISHFGRLWPEKINCTDAEEASILTILAVSTVDTYTVVCADVTQTSRGRKARIEEVIVDSYSKQ